MDDSIQACINDLNQSDVAKQAEAAEKLAHLAEIAQPAIIPLIQNCSSDDEDVCNWCTSALEGVGSPAAEQIDGLILLAKAANESTAYWAITLLGRAGELAALAVPILIERLNDALAPSVQCRAAWALGRLECKDNLALNSLREATASNNRALVTQAQRALARIETQ